jgi:hypothetical protein
MVLWCVQYPIHCFSSSYHLLVASANGCQSNCDNGPGPYVSPPWQVVYDPHYIFPPGNYSSTGGNPCGTCSNDNAVLKSNSSQYCCTQNIQCFPIEYNDCLVSLGCTYNCLEVTIDSDACQQQGQCDPTTTTVLQPFATATSSSN